MSLLERFFAANRRFSEATVRRLPAVFWRHPHTLYKYEVAELLNRRPGQNVLDIGGGKDCPFLPYVKEPRGHLIIALDYSEQELRHNHQLDRKIVADAAAYGFPFRDGSADLVVSRAVIEHIRDNASFFENCAGVLRPGGLMVHTFSGRFAPFALINQLLPNALTRRLIGYLHPEWKEWDNYGFPAFYHLCYYSAVKDLLDRNGFKDVSFTLLYYQSLYFGFFFPLFVLMLAYDLVVWVLGIRDLASGILVTAVRGDVPPPSSRLQAVPLAPECRSRAPHRASDAEVTRA